MSSERRELWIGYSQVDITPPVGEFGSFRLAPNKRSLGVHDPLYVHALYLNNANDAQLLVSVDCVALPAGFVAKIKQAVRKVVDLDDSRILVAATHTHNGAEALCEEPVVDYGPQINRIVGGCARAAEKAVNGCFPAKAGWGHVDAPGIAKNRFEARLENGNVDKVDERLDFLKIEDADGNHKGVLWHFAAHPTTCMKAGYMSSADYYGVVNRLVVEELGGFSMFFNGAAGNINPELGERTFEKAENTGRAIAEKLVVAVPPVETQDHLALASATVEVDFPLTEKRKDLVLPDDREEILNYFRRIESLELSTTEEYEKLWPDYQRLRVSWWRHRLVEEFDGVEAERIVLNGHRIGDHLLLTVPGELFIEFQFELQKAFPGQRAMIFGYANGYNGYIPDAESFDADSYETNPTIVHRAGRQAGRLIVEKGIDLLRKL